MDVCLPEADEGVPRNCPEETGGEAGIRTLGRTLKALQRFSKPPPSASRPPHLHDSGGFPNRRASIIAIESVQPITIRMAAVLLLGCRVLHIAATCTSLGGLFYARMVLWPTLPQLSPAEREPFFREMVRRYAIIKWFGIGIISVTGVIQWLYLWPVVTNRSAYLLYFGIKMSAAVGLLSITALLAVPDARLARMQTDRQST